MLRKRIAAVAIAFGLVSAFAVTPASATPDPSAVLDPALDEVLLVSAEELAEAGFPAPEIERQEATIAALSPTQRAQQARLRAEASRYAAGDAEHTIRVGPRLSTTKVTPLIVGRDCSDSSKWYRIKYRSGGSNLQYCVAGAGTWTVTTISNGQVVNTYLPGGQSLRAGAQVGRSMYRMGPDGDLLWSTWRGPNDYTEHEFNQFYGAVRVYKIEISSGPTTP